MTDRFSSDARDVYNLALRQALQLGHNYIQPEHLLLALIRQEDSVAVAALARLGVDASALRQMVLTVLRDDLQEKMQADRYDVRGPA